MRHLLDFPEPPDALFAANDLTALGALHAAGEAGLWVPHDLALVGYDDVPVAALTQPGRTTMAMPTQELGRAAAELVVRSSSTRLPVTTAWQPESEPV